MLCSSQSAASRCLNLQQFDIILKLCAMAVIVIKIVVVIVAIVSFTLLIFAFPGQTRGLQAADGILEMFHVTDPTETISWLNFGELFCRLGYAFAKLKLRCELERTTPNGVV